jgi:hypothetical protein
MNGLRLYARRRVDFSILGILVFGQEIADETIVVVSLPTVTQVAPLAMPICHLLNDRGDFSVPSLCSGERFFTSSQHYCSSGAPCSLTPSFTWEPKTQNIYIPIDGVFDKQLPPENRPLADQVTDCQNRVASQSPPRWFQCDFVSDPRCNWDSPRYPQAADNYGVVGMPGSSGTTTEGAVMSLKSTHFQVSAEIGQPFAILPSGFTQKVSEDDLFDFIMGKDNAYNPDHVNRVPLRASSTLNDGANPSRWYEYNKYSPTTSTTTSTSTSVDTTTTTSVLPTPTPTATPTATPTGTPKSSKLIWPLEAGASAGLVDPSTDLRNSRAALGPNTVTTISTVTTPQVAPEVNSPSGVYPNSISPAQTGGNSLIGAPTSPLSCSDLTASSTNYGICNSRRFGPHPDAGFIPEGYGIAISALRLDRDIVWSDLIPVIADFSDSAAGCGVGGFDPEINTAGDWQIIGFVRANLFDVDIGNPPPTYPSPKVDPQVDAHYNGMFWPYPEFPDYDPSRAWGFPQACNLIRGKLDCDRNILPSIGGYPSPVVIK